MRAVDGGFNIPARSDDRAFCCADSRWFAMFTADCCACGIVNGVIVPFNRHRAQGAHGVLWQTKSLMRIQMPRCPRAPRGAPPQVFAGRGPTFNLALMVTLTLQRIHGRRCSRATRLPHSSRPSRKPRGRQGNRRRHGRNPAHRRKPRNQSPRLVTPSPRTKTRTKSARPIQRTALFCPTTPRTRMNHPRTAEKAARTRKLLQGRRRHWSTTTSRPARRTGNCAPSWRRTRSASRSWRHRRDQEGVPSLTRCHPVLSGQRRWLTWRNTTRTGSSSLSGPRIMRTTAMPVRTQKARRSNTPQRRCGPTGGKWSGH